MKVRKIAMGFGSLMFVLFAQAPAEERTLPSPLVLDVRTAAEYAAGHLEEAINVPHDVIGKRIAALAPNKDTPMHLLRESATTNTGLFR